ncbi:GNAT family N-acetyltransferase [Maliponia aquimaris]|nr:GNAT family N-acetyltransferase [Maliponia aquimaris]
MSALLHTSAPLCPDPTGTVPAYRIASVTEVTDRRALDDLLLEYYGVIVGKLTAGGVPHGYTPEDLKASFWPNLHRVLPPTGRLILVHDDADRLVGCGTLQQVRADAGELKRLYVRPEAKGHRLGRAIVDARIEAARDMGWTTLLVNAIRGNRDMLQIYESLGFRFIDRYPECSDPIEMDPYFIYMQYDIT